MHELKVVNITFIKNFQLYSREVNVLCPLFRLSFKRGSLYGKYQFEECIRGYVVTIMSLSYYSNL